MQREKRDEGGTCISYDTHLFPSGRASICVQFSDFSATSGPIIGERRQSTGYAGARLVTTVAPHPATVGVVLERAHHARSFFPRKLRIRRPRDEWQFHKTISAVRYQSSRCNRHGATRLRLRYDFPAIRNVPQLDKCI